MNYQDMDEEYQSMDEIIMSAIINKYHKYEAFKLTTILIQYTEHFNMIKPTAPSIGDMNN